MEQIADTMLHELVHIVHGPHGSEFHAMWNQLRDEHESLLRKGYTGEGFLSEGNRLGGARIPLHEARRLARVAAEGRRAQFRPQTAPGRRLGGRKTDPAQDIRHVIADATEKRNRTLRGCGNTTRNDDEIQIISESATRNGFKTKADEDAANDAAIAQALWELVQEDEMARYGADYIAPSAEHPMGNGGGAVRRRGDSPPAYVEAEPHSIDDEEMIGGTSEQGWTCGICTLHNPPTFLCCDACGAERGGGAINTQGPAEARPNVQRQRQQQPRKPEDASTRPVVVDLTGSSPPRRSGARPSRTEEREAPKHPHPPTWMCSFCGNTMAREWWSCARCGTIKDNSR
jgi:hypothetical protein